MKSTEEMLETYKNELREYDKWLQQKKKEYNCSKERPLRPMEMFDNSDWDKIMQWNAKINGMEEALGLTKEEIKKYEAEFFTKDE